MEEKLVPREPRRARYGSEIIDTLVVVFARPREVRESLSDFLGHDLSAHAERDRRRHLDVDVRRDKLIARELPQPRLEELEICLRRGGLDVGSSFFGLLRFAIRCFGICHAGEDTAMRGTSPIPRPSARHCGAAVPF
jgi:hypothetical protein